MKENLRIKSSRRKNVIFLIAFFTIFYALVLQARQSSFVAPAPPGVRRIPVMMNDDARNNTRDPAANVVASHEPHISIFGRLPLCEGDSVLLDAGAGFQSYQWSTGSTDRQIIVKSAGLVIVTALDSLGDGGSDTLLITMQTQKITSGGPTDFCEGDSVTLSVNDSFISYLWSDGSVSSSITVKTGGVYKVHVVDGAGCRSSGSITVSTHPAPKPLITGPQKVCLQTTCEYEVNFMLGFLYVWSLDDTTGTIDSGNSTAHIYVHWTSPGTGVVRLLERSYNGCFGNASMIVSINNSPSPSISADGPLTFCEGDSVALEAGTGYQSYLWTDGSSSEKIRVRKSGTYSVTVTDTNGCSGASQSLAVTVIPCTASDPVITADYCIGNGDVRLTTAGFPSYLWSTGERMSSIIVHQAGKYSVTVQDSAGSSKSDTINVGGELISNGDFSAGNIGFITAYRDSTNLWNDGTYHVTANAGAIHNGFFGTDHTNPGSGLFMAVNGNTVSGITVWQQDITVVPNTQYYFSAWAMSMNAVGNYAQLQFSINGTTLGMPFQLPPNTSKISPFTWHQFYEPWNSGSDVFATIKIIDLQTAPAGNDFGIDDISFSTLPPVSLSANPSGNGPVCSGDTLRLFANANAGTHPLTFNWRGPNTFTSTEENPVVAASAESMTGIYSVKVTDANGCTATASTTVTVKPTPVITAVMPASRCDTGSVVLEATASAGTIRWYSAPAGGAILDVGTSFTTPVLASTTTFYVEATADGCTTPVRTPVAATVYALQKPLITRAGNVLSSSPALEYQWYRNDSLIADATNATYAMTAGGAYKVKIKDANGCDAESDAFNVAFSSFTLSCLTSNVFNPGETATLKILLTSSSNLLSQSLHCRMQLRFNGTVLSPMFDFQTARSLNNERIVSLSLTRPAGLTSGTLLELPFTVMLGDAECAAVHLDSVAWLTGDAIVLLENQDCDVCVNVCRAGGARLFSSGGKVQLFQNQPNPFNAQTVIEFELIENGFTDLSVYDILGRKIATLVQGNLESGRRRVSFDAGGLASGLYVYVLTTPAQSFLKTMMISK